MIDRGVPFGRACSVLEKLLAGPARREIVSVASASSMGKGLARLRDGLRAHTLAGDTQTTSLQRIVVAYDRRTRQEGLHALHDWDGKADAVNPDSIPVDVLNFLIAQRGGEPCDDTVLAIVLDYYLLYVLALLSLRVWDEDSADTNSADRNLDRLDELLRLLQGPDGSGQQFAADAATLILIATSHFEIEERGYHMLLERVRTLGRAHQVKIALGHAVSMGCHLRFGFEATYARDTVVMRDDNVADYPWLCFAVATLMGEYSRLQSEGASEEERSAIVEALLNGLSPDARSLVGVPPSSLAACEPERAEFAERFREHRDALLGEFERYRPTDKAYSPLSFFFNFSHNVLKGTVVDALLRGAPWTLTLDALFTAASRGGDTSAAKEELAITLMAYARANPDRIRGRLTPVIVYDPQAGRQAFAVTMRKLRE